VLSEKWGELQVEETEPKSGGDLGKVERVCSVGDAEKWSKASGLPISTRVRRRGREDGKHRSS